MYLSVIIPCYNTEKELIERCVNSVLVQNFSDYEILIIDDGSDAVHKMTLENIALLDARIQLIHQENRGVSAARNEGIRRAAGEYIVFADADDVLVSSFFEEAVHITQTQDVDLLIGGNAHLNNDKFSVEKQNQDDIVCYSLSVEEKRNFKCNLVGNIKHIGTNGGYWARGPYTRLIKREIVINCLFHEGLRMGEDIVWNLQLLDRCENVMLAERIWYLYYINPNSACNKYNPKMLDNVLLELPEIKTSLDWRNARHRAAFTVRMLEELEKIYLCYIGNKNCVLNYKERREIERKLYASYPWLYIKEKSISSYLGIKDKLRTFAYRTKCFSFYIKVKTIINGIR